jgi:SAM-dependent methyltransferase
LSNVPLPVQLRRFLHLGLLRARQWPPRGAVRFGALRRLTPIGADWGFSRGLPIDRWYIEHFLERQADKIQGRVLEIDTDSYTRKFGGERVEQSDVLHLSEMRPGITMVGDLALPDSFPEDVFDCIVLTQTVNLVFDARAALLSTRKMLKPGGVALITVPGISPMFGDADGRWGHCWSFTTHSFSRLLEDVFAEDTVTVSSCGNVLSTTAFLHGLASEDLKVSELEHRDPAFEMLVLATVVKRGGAG